MGKTEFNDSEKRIIHILMELTTPVTVIEITDIFYDGDVPLHGRNRINAMIRTINAKAERWSRDFIIRGGGVGRNGKTVWLEGLE